MSVFTNEPNLVGSSRDSTHNAVLMTFNPDTDAYVWSKVFVNVKKVADVHNVYFTPDGTKVLMTGNFKMQDDIGKDQYYGSYIYLNADSGAFISAIRNPGVCCPNIFKDGLVITYDGSMIFSLAHRKSLTMGALAVARFNGA